MKGNGLVGDKIYFEADVAPDREPLNFPAKVFIAGVLRRAGDYACKSALNLLQLEDILVVYTM